MTTHTCTEHAPGTPSCYCHHRCRCAACRWAKTRTLKEWRLRKDRGQVAVVDALGTTRRLRALAALGWTHSAMGDLIGMHRSAVSRLVRGEHDHVLLSTANAVADLYQHAQDGCPHPNPRTISQARKHGWAPPAAWDDDDLDNPDAVPDAARHRKTRELRESRIEDVLELLAYDEHPVMIAHRLGMRLDALVRQLERHAPEVAAQLKAAQEPTRERKAS